MVNDYLHLLQKPDVIHCTLVCVGDEMPDPSFWPEGNGNASDGICLLPSSENI
ncbi:hypothetical protein T4C_10707 [Trichinella pseudospiralis]|uniref:Uncharacterized protein n=1 Tax=Trichinella pseudospiralis TaxID=6337 RepID=A0A0V1GA94_TRIPS|nr:hypothetical protein T4C_10707 [Trichinella pseudospiralis]